MVQRFSMYIEKGWYDAYEQFEKLSAEHCSYGEWVKFDTYKNEIARKDAEIERLKNKLKNKEKTK